MRTLIFLTAFGGMLLVIPCSAEAQPDVPDAPSAAARLDSAYTAWRNDRPSAVIALLGPTEQGDTATASAYELLGRSYQALRRHEEATRAFEGALGRGGPSAALLTALGESYRARGQLREAERAQRRALSLASVERSQQIRLRLAAVLEDQRDWSRAAALYRTLLAADSTNMVVRKRLAHAEAERRRPDSARSHYRFVHQHWPQDAGVALSLTRILSDEKQYASALAVTRRTLQHRDWPALWRRHGNLAFQIDSLAVAEAAYENAIARGDSSAALLQRLGIVRVGQNRPAEALPPLRASYRRDSTRATTSFYLGTAYRSTDQPDRARTAYERAVDQASSGTLTDALIQLAPVYSEQGRLPEALDTYRLVLRLQPNRHAVYFHLATLYDEHYKDKTVAAQYYRRFLEQQTESAPQLKEYAQRRLDALQPTLHLQSGRPPQN